MTGRFRTAASMRCAVVLAAILLISAGCGDSDLEKAQQDAREAKATVKKLELSLAKAMQEIADQRAELAVVRETRDELQRQVDQLAQERDNAAALAQQAEQVITHLSSRAEGQVGATAALRKQVEDLKAVIADQQALIEELQKGGAVESLVPSRPEGTGDANEPEGGPGA